MRRPSFQDYNAASCHNPWNSDKSALILSSNLFLSTFPGRPPLLNKEEARAVILHELLHIKNRDSAKTSIHNQMVSAGVAMTMVTAVFALMGAAPVAGAFVGVAAVWGGRLLYSRGSRSMESFVDEQVVRITKDPQSYAGALRKLERQNAQMKAFLENAQKITLQKANGVEGVLFEAGKKAVASAGTGIGLQQTMARLLPTHPPFRQRIAAILDQGRQLGLTASGEKELLEKPLAEATGGVFLPPFSGAFTIKETEGKKQVTVLTSLDPRADFNRAVRGYKRVQNDVGTKNRPPASPSSGPKPPTGP